MKTFSRYILPIILLCGCTSPGSRLQVDVSKIAVPGVSIHRYDRALFRMDPDNLRSGLEEIRNEYPFFLNTDLSDTLKLLALQDYLQNERNRTFFAACDSAFPDLSGLEKELTDAFRHLLYYYPGMRIPRVYGYVSGGDYQYPVQWADSVLLIGLDCYLGRDFSLYKYDRMPLYRAMRTNRDNILPDAMGAVYAGFYPETFPGNTLLDNMIAGGKRILFTDAMIPDAEGCLKMGYTPEQYEWASSNEEHVWAAIIGNNLLFGSDGQVLRSFMADGPFTAEFSKESPPRLGEYIGWRILLQYLERNPGITLPDLLKETDSQKILAGSKYKPGK